MTEAINPSTTLCRDTTTVLRWCKFWKPHERHEESVGKPDEMKELKEHIRMRIHWYVILTGAAIFALLSGCSGNPVSIGGTSAKSAAPGYTGGASVRGGNQIGRAHV